MRQVSLLIGRQSYSMKTALSDEDIKDAQEIVNDIMRDTGMSSEQEIRLALACMVLANRLAVAGRRLDNIVSRGEAAREEEIKEKDDNDKNDGDNDDSDKDKDNKGPIISGDDLLDTGGDDF